MALRVSTCRSNIPKMWHVYCFYFMNVSQFQFWWISGLFWALFRYIQYYIYMILPTTIHYNDFMRSTTAFIKINIISLIQILLHKYPLWWHHHCFLNADDSARGSGQTNISPTNRNRQKSQRQTKLFNSVQYLTKSSTWPAGVENHFWGISKFLGWKQREAFFMTYNQHFVSDRAQALSIRSLQIFGVIRPNHT